tara:strand:- start:1234 stop:2364 length:1131 start_codon:yes stop_codon:yes gene_type:complete
MNTFRKYYISIGSNIGDKFKNIQNALDIIHTKIASFISISAIYETKAVGFEGDNFFNVCASFNSRIEPENLMNELLQVEVCMGRKRKNIKTYESRIIDIDILIAGDLVMEKQALSLPHPRMTDRLFVMLPLVEIEPNLLHPILNLSCREILNKIENNDDVKKTNLVLNNPRNIEISKKYNYIAIEGNIGSGKTSLSNQIANDFDSKLILERFIDNPFLEKFYKDTKQYAFKLEMSFLADRYQQTVDDLSQLNFFNSMTISDYDIHKSLIFSKINLNIDEFNLYRKLFYSLHKSFIKPDLIIFLKNSVENLKKNIKKRGRIYESNISDDYLININSSYSDFFKSRPDLKVKYIDVSEINFVENRLDYLSILKEIVND